MDTRTGLEIAAAHDRDGTWPHRTPVQPQRRRRPKPAAAFFAPTIVFGSLVAAAPTPDPDATRLDVNR